MPPTDAKRKLTAILISDVAGYSRLMAEDEQATLHTLNAHRAVFAKYIEESDGRIVNAPGDSILAEFGSVVDAVSAAVEIQRELAEKNAAMPTGRAMHFRIGINLGDVMVSGDEIYGDGVNVASRLESLADPGGIYISGTVFTSVEGKIPISFEFQGNQQVKNIAKPVAAYKVLSTPGAAAHRVVRARRKGKLIGLAAAGAAVVALVAAGIYFTLPTDPPPTPTSGTEEGQPIPTDRPSIAVLPFTNLSGDPEQEYFSDGFTDTLITALSNLRDIYVIARNSTFVYKGKAVDVRQVGRELGVRHVLEGSIQKAGGRIRVNAQLLDAETGAHLWADKYDREFKDIFAVQDEITQKILTELDVALVEGAQGASWRRSTENPEAYELFLRGREARTRSTREDSARARGLFEQALELDPNFTAALFGLGGTHMADAYSGWSESPSESYEKAMALAEKAITLDPEFAGAYDLLGEILIMYKGEHEKGLEIFRQAVALAPNSARYNWTLGVYLCISDRAEEGLEYVKTAFRLSPHPTAWFYHGYGQCYLHLGRFEEAIASSKKSIAGVPDFIWPHLVLTVTYMVLGRVDEARAEAKEVLRINPKFSVEDNPFIIVIANPETRKRFKSLMRQAGLP
jgi:adenylate cyclase